MKTLFLIVALAQQPGFDLGGPTPPPRPTPVVEIAISQHAGLIVASPVVTATPDALEVTHRWVIDRDGGPVADSDVEKCPDNSRIVLAAGPPGTRYTFRLGSDFLFGLKKTGTVDGVPQNVFVDVQHQSLEFVTKTLVVAPPASPTLPVAPAAPIPSGRFGLAPRTFGLFRDEPGLLMAEKQKLARTLAVAYQGVVDRISVNSLYADVMKDVAASGGSSLKSAGIDPARLSAIRDGLAAGVNTALTTGKPVSTTDLMQALQEVVLGLKAVNP